jgi:predicted ester cyclase
MDLAKMKETANRFHIDIIQNFKLEVADEIVAPDAIIRTPFRPLNDPKRGPEIAKDMARGDKEAFPKGLFFNQDKGIAEGNWVAIRWDAHGMNSGPLGTIPPSNKELKFSGVDIYRFNDKGQIAEAWVYYDALNLFKQLGAEVKLPG